MDSSFFVNAEEIQDVLGVSRAEAYRIIKKLNTSLSNQGYIVISGKVSRRYLEEMIYGYPTKVEAKQGG